MSQQDRLLLVLGTRLFAEELFDLVSEIEGFQIEAFVENLEQERCNGTLEGRPIIWVDHIQPLANTCQAICGITTTLRDRFVEQVRAYGVKFATLIHPTARVSGMSSIGEGSIISPGVIVASHTSLGKHVFVNRAALIGHHTHIGDYVSIQPGANIAGACHIGEKTYIGMGAIVIDHITIGKNSIIAAGAVVTKDVPENVLVAGIPAKVIKENVDRK